MNGPGFVPVARRPVGKSRKILIGDRFVGIGMPWNSAGA
jgi:hypothetical protein